MDTLHRTGVETTVDERIMGHSVRIAKDVYRKTSEYALQRTRLQEI